MSSAKSSATRGFKITESVLPQIIEGAEPTDAELAEFLNRDPAPSSFSIVAVLGCAGTRQALEKLGARYVALHQEVKAEEIDP